MTLQELVDHLTELIWALEEQTQRPEDNAVLSYLRDAVTAELEYRRRHRVLARQRVELEPVDQAPAEPRRSRLRASSRALVLQVPVAPRPEVESPPPTRPLRIRRESLTVTDGARAAAIGLFAGSILRVGLGLSPAVAAALLHTAVAGGFAPTVGPVLWRTLLGVIVVPLAAAATCWLVVDERRDFWMYIALACTTLPLLGPS